MKESIWKWLILVAVVAWSVVLVTPIREKVKLGLDLQGGTSYTLQLDSEALKEVEGGVAAARERALEVVRNRVDGMGVAEPNIYPDGEDRIVVQIPGMKAEDRERASENIRKAAFLTFRMVHQRNDELVANLFADRKVPEGYEIVTIPENRYNNQAWKRIGAPPTTAERKKIAAFEEQRGYDLLLQRIVVGNNEYFYPNYVNRRQELTGESLVSAGISYDHLQQRTVDMTFDGQGAKKFAQLTKDYAPGGRHNPSATGRRQLAIVLDDTLYSAPVIQTEILGGKAQITGNFTLEEANSLKVVLQAGSLPAPLNVIEERTVDPTLGMDSIQSGKRAAVWGLIIVAVFILFYYRFAGLVADIALGLNLVLLPLGMIITSALFSMFVDSGGTSSWLTLPTLTLPGIAGIVLTIGMAVDANVLIFERIREEMATGKRFGAAISAGYDKAFTTIFDSNITTVLTAAILFWQGSGPVKGFAVTLTAGIIASMYTAIVVTRMIFGLLEGHGILHNLKMMQLVKATNFDFLGKRYLAGGLSLVLIIGSLAIFYVRGEANFGVDFTGGQMLSLTFTQKVDVDQLRSAFTSAGVRDAAIQYQRGAGTADDEKLTVKVATGEEGALVQNVLASNFADSQFVLAEEVTVGAQVGKELQRRGLMAVGFALIGMIIYITIRFEFSFAIGAVVGLIHNILLTLGLFCLFGRQLSMTSIAAFLTVLGYSVNDTIVVFDRIREKRKLNNGRLDVAIANLSINQTLSRTLLTSVTTLLSIVMLLLFGGGAIQDFALALFIGVIVGTYASIFIATPVMLAVRSKSAPGDAKK